MYTNICAHTCAYTHTHASLGFLSAAFSRETTLPGVVSMIQKLRAFKLNFRVIGNVSVEGYEVLLNSWGVCPAP